MTPPRRQIRRVRYRHWIFALPFVRRYNGMVVGRTILFKGGANEIPPALFRHELIHQEQIDRHGIVRFYLIYFRDYLANLWPTDIRRPLMRRTSDRPNLCSTSLFAEPSAGQRDHLKA
jgi:hypothetical protein